MNTLILSVLIVDSESTLATAVANDLTRAIVASQPGPRRLDVAVEADFSKARRRLHVGRPSLMVTALRLRAYNGLHLVYVAAGAGSPMRSVVHTETVDPVHAREVRAAGAFYEVRSRLARVLPVYARAVLPPEDRRDPLRSDRRRIARGGRRTVDQAPPI